MSKNCKHCNEVFLAQRKDKVFCSKSCKSRFTTNRLRQENPEKYSSYNKSYYDSNKDKIRARSRQHRLDNLDNFKQKKQKWQEKFKEKHGISYAAFRRQNSLNERIKHNVRSRLSKAIRGVIKSGSAVDDLGCSIENFKTYLESKWTEGMSWDNYSEWEIDHIIPLDSFDLSDPEQLKNACHFSNLQPLWLPDNRSKRNKHLEVADE